MKDEPVNIVDRKSKTIIGESYRKVLAV